MSLKEPFPKSIPEETRLIGEELLLEDSVYRLIGEKGDEIITDADFEDIYSGEGRPGVNPVVLAFVMVFQYLEKLPDRKAAEMAVWRMDWKYALRQALTWSGFHYSDLSNFRKRLLNNGQDMLIFEKVVAYLLKEGYIKSRGKQRTDATHILGQVMKLSRLELVEETIRLAVSALISADMPWTLRHLPSTFTERHNARRDTYKLSKTEIKEAIQEAGEDGDWLVERVEQHASASLKELPEMQMLKRVLEEQFSWSDDENRPKARSNEEMKGDILQTPHDPDVRYGSKGGQGWQGYKLQVSETIAEEAKPQTARFITDIKVTPANESDQAALEPLQERLIERGMVPAKQYVDQNYMSGEHIHTSRKKGIDLRGYVHDGGSQKEEGFRLTDFLVHIDKQLALCPAGKKSVRWTEVSTTKNVAYRASFGEQCRACPFFESGQCTTSPAGRRLDINRYHDELRARRLEAKSKVFQLEMNQRNGVEGTISELVRAHGARRSRYRGLAKNQLQASFVGAAINLKRLAKALNLLLSFRRWAFSA